MTAWDSIERFRRTKYYDLLAASPLIVWMGYGGWKDAIQIQPHLYWIANGSETTLGYLQTVALVMSAVFCALLVVLLMTRTVPRARAAGVAPRALAVAGTFIGGIYLHLTPVPLPFWLQIAVVILIVVAATLEILILMWLGKSFSIMAEARNLVTEGPYAFARHPLYAAEIIGALAMLIQFFGWAACGVFLSFAGIQVARSFFEENILEETFPEYGAYRARTARFIPLVW